MSFKKIQTVLFLFFFAGVKLSAYNNIILPTIPQTQYNITSYGAATTSADNTLNIQNAINDCSNNGGGIVIVPSGTFMCGPLVMKNQVDLRISDGATLKLLPYGTYPNNGTAEKYNPFIKGYENTNIRVSGSGTIDAQGAEWWTAYETSGRTIGRPGVIRLDYCDKSQIDGLKIIDAPNVHITIGKGCTNSTISNVTILTPDGTPNTDGIDTWSPYIDIVNCNISCGDDDIAMDSPSSYVTVKHCTFGTGHGCSIGSYASGITHILVDSCTFNGTGNGARMKSSRDRGGVEEYISYSNLTMNNVGTPLSISSYYPNEPVIPDTASTAAVTATTPRWSHVTFKNITATSTSNAGVIWGLPEMSISDVVFDNVQITAPIAMKAYNVNGLQFINGSTLTIPIYGRLNSKVVDTYNTTVSGINLRTGQSQSTIPTEDPTTLLVSPTGANSGSVQPYSLNHALSQAQHGNILLLSEGTYTEDITFPDSKTITLRKAPSTTTKPIISSNIMDPSLDGGSLIFNEIEINPSGDFFYNISANHDIKGLQFVNCDIKNIAKSLINSSSGNSGAIQSILLDSCTISLCGTSKTNFINAFFLLDSMTVVNTTINNFRGGDFIKPQPSTLAQTFNLLISNNTIYKSIINGGYAFCSIGGSCYNNAKCVFKHNIFDGAAASVTPRIIYTLNGGGSVVEENNLNIGWDNYIRSAYSGARTNLTLNTGSLSGINEVPYFYSVNNDFSIPEGSVLATAGTNGLPLGDPRWIVKNAAMNKTAGDFIAIASGDVNNPANWGLIASNGWSIGSVSTSTPNNNTNIWVPLGKRMTTSTNVNSKDLNISGELTASNPISISGNLKILSDYKGTGTILGNQNVVVSGTTQVQQFLPSSRNWYLSSPVSNAVVPANAYTFYKRNEPAGVNGWETLISGSQLIPGKGYVANLSTGSATYTFEGNLNYGNIEIPVTRTVGVDSEGFNLVGNPYASYLNWDQVIAASTNVKTSIWERTKNRSNAYVFDTYNSAGKIGTDNSLKGANGNIAPMQAFWVQVAEGQTSGTVRLTDAMRSHKGNKAILGGTVSDPMFKTAQSENPKSMVSLIVTNGLNSDEAVLYFDANASNGYDEYDSPKIFNNNMDFPEIFTLVEGRKLVINGMNLPTINTEIPLGFKTSRSNKYKISVNKFLGFDSLVQVILTDNSTGKEILLTLGEEYSFSSDSISTENRFALQFKTSSFTTDLNELKDDAIKIITTDKERLFILNNKDEIMQITVYSLTGQKMMSASINESINTIEHTLKKGAYLLTAQNKQYFLSRKFVIE